MTVQRRTALMSVGAAATLVILKLSVGLTANSLGLVSEAVHSGTDLVAALLTFLAIGVAGRPADVSHQYGHGKAEHLAALAEASFLSLASIFIGIRAVERLTASTKPTVHVTWYVLATVAVVIVVDATRAGTSWRVSRQTGSAALASNALHFASDLAGSLAVLVGLLLARAGLPGRRRARSAVRRNPGPARRRTADPRQRGRAHGSGAGRRRGQGARGDRRARACGGAAAAAHAAGRRPPVCRRRDRRRAVGGGRPGTRGGRRGRGGGRAGAPG